MFTSKTVRTILTFAAAAIGFIAATDPIGLPTWAQGIIAALAVGFAAIGIIPPNMTVWHDDTGATRTLTAKKYPRR